MIASVSKAIDIMSQFTPERPIRTLHELSTSLGYPRSTVHAMLSTLESRGFIERTDENSYALGKALIPLTQSVRVNVELRDRAAPLLRELGDYCNESVYLTVLDGAYALYVYAIESSHRLLARSAVGDRVPLHCTSVGKAMLAYMSEDAIEHVLQETGMERFTDRTITERDALLQELEKIRSQRYSTDFSEHEEGQYCVGAPIFDARGTLIGACSISGNIRVQTNVENFSDAVRFTAQEVSRRMGFVPSADKMLWKSIDNPLRKPAEAL